MAAASGKKRGPRPKDSRREGAPSPPYNVPHPIGPSPLGIRRAGFFLLLCISQTPEMHPRPFFLGFWHPRWSFAGVFRIRKGIRGHPRVRLAHVPVRIDPVMSSLSSLVVVLACL